MSSVAAETYQPSRRYEIEALIVLALAWQGVSEVRVLNAPLKLAA